VLHELRDALREVGADVVFLQEVQGEHSAKAVRHENWPDRAQYEFLADQVWSDYAYGQNAAYRNGHHGNALLSKFPILEWAQHDVTTNPIEQRGFLYCEIDVPGMGPLYCVCIHLGLTAVARRKQLVKVEEFVLDRVPEDKPLIVAGDTNDWSGVPTGQFSKRLGLHEVFKSTRGRHARTFPSKSPMLCLDRIYVRGLEVRRTEVFFNGHWAKLSDHAPIMTELVARASSP
jgi:endonuclease/exonuclease/phosphatase family metal-dependent hydrolase